MNGNNTDFGFGGIWGVIMLLIVAGLFGNGFGLGGGNAAGVSEEFLDNRLMARDTFNVNTNLLDTKYALGTEILNNRYQAQLGDCGLSKEILQNRYDNALQTQTLSAQMNECCSATKQLIIEENQKTRDLIQNTYIEGLRTALSDAKTEISNRDQTSAILNQLGRFHAYPSCGCGMGCTTYSQNLI